MENTSNLSKERRMGILLLLTAITLIVIITILIPGLIIGTPRLRLMQSNAMDTGSPKSPKTVCDAGGCCMYIYDQWYCTSGY